MKLVGAHGRHWAQSKRIAKKNQPTLPSTTMCCGSNADVPPQTNTAKCWAIPNMVFTIISCIGFLGGAWVQVCMQQHKQAAQHSNSPPPSFPSRASAASSASSRARSRSAAGRPRTRPTRRARRRPRASSTSSARSARSAAPSSASSSSSASRRLRLSRALPHGAGSRRTRSTSAFL